MLRAKQDIEGFEAAGREETDSTDTGVELLKAIRDAGGIKDDGGGEFATLWEASTGFVPQGKTKAGDRYKKSRNYATGGLLGVGNVLRKYGSGGQSWDYIREALSQDPAFRRFADMSATDLMNEVMELVGTRTAQGQGREGCGGIKNGFEIGRLGIVDRFGHQQGGLHPGGQQAGGAANAIFRADQQQAPLTLVRDSGRDQVVGLDRMLQGIGARVMLGRPRLAG